MEPHEKAQALMDKALSTTSEEEARTCALTAVKLMKKAGITIGGNRSECSPQELVVRQALMGRYEAMRAQAEYADARVVDLERRLKAAMAARKPTASAATATAKSVKPGQPPAWNSGKSGPFSRGTSKSPGRAAPGRTAAGGSASETPRWITAKFDSECSRCKLSVWEGDPVWWFGPRKGAICQSCREAEKAAE